MEGPVGPEIELLIHQRSTVISRLALIAEAIASTKANYEGQRDDEKTYERERGGDLELLKLKRSDGPTISIAQNQNLSAVIPIQDAIEHRLQSSERRCETDYSVILDADVFSANRKGKPYDKSIVGIGGAAEQVRPYHKFYFVI